MKVKHKITHIISGLEMGGAERSLFLSLKGQKETYSLSVISLKGEGVYGQKIKDLGIPVHYCNFSLDRNILKNFFKFRDYIKKLNPDLIQGWMYHGNIASILAKKLFLPAIPVVWNIRHSLYSITSEKILIRLIIKLNKYFSKDVDKLLYNSDIAKSQHQALGFKEDNSVVIYNGYDLNFLKPDSKVRECVRKKLCIEENVRVIGHVARFHPMKDHKTFLLAALEILKQTSNVIFMLIGTRVDSTNKELMKLIPEQMNEHFIFLGEQTKVYDYMQSMDLFCSTSAWGEGFSNVLAEGMSLGLFCISTDIGQASEIVRSKGRIVPPSNVEALTNEIMSVLSLEHQDFKRTGKQARERINEHYSLSKTTDDYKRIYDNLLC